MSTFETTIRVTSLTEQREGEFKVLVDTGAFYSILPSSTLDDLGVRREGETQFVYADGRAGAMDIGFVFIELNGSRAVPTIVAFGNDDGPALLGSYALEGMELMVDPLGEQLLPRGPLNA